VSHGPHNNTMHHASRIYPCLPPCRRLLQNPAYYDLEDPSPEGLSDFMSGLVEDALTALADSGCVQVGGWGDGSCGVARGAVCRGASAVLTSARLPARAPSRRHTARNTQTQLDALDDDDEAAAENGGGAVRPTPLGRVASLYYLQHTTAGLIAECFAGQQLNHTQARCTGDGWRSIAQQALLGAVHRAPTATSHDTQSPLHCPPPPIFILHPAPRCLRC
jgi:hypothetical protein